MLIRMTHGMYSGRVWAGFGEGRHERRESG